RGAFGMIQDLAQIIIGMDPLDNEVIWEKLYKSTFWGQNGGPVIFSAISALDTALWDIRGKFFKVPVYQLLGGKMRSRLRSYASQLQFGWDDRKIPALSVEDYVRNAKKAVAEGYDAIKFDFFTYDPDGHRYCAEETTRRLIPRHFNIVVGRLAAVREAVGPDVDIIMENHAYIDAQGAVQLGRAAEEFNVMYFEEPCTPTPEMTKFVAERVRVPISQGERVYSRWGYAPYFVNGSAQLIQPDIGNCGGITEAKKICDMAHVYDVGVQAHVCASPLSTAAALQLEAAIPNFTIHEHHVYNRFDYNRQLCIHDYQPHDGFIEVPDLPGLGNELSDFCFSHGEVVTVQ
ncbi:MAG: mandelate racemase/muconate lactonizing enzyme family protein, partial [Fretibacterium sp.]|nr:mandelate racemase/muconate lactonizing enzyme family protein [Fretibacterium sp.]